MLAICAGEAEALNRTGLAFLLNVFCPSPYLSARFLAGLEEHF